MGGGGWWVVGGAYFVVIGGGWWVEGGGGGVFWRDAEKLTYHNFEETTIRRDSNLTPMPSRSCT